MSKRWRPVLGLAVALWCGHAEAADKAQCFDAAGQAQTLRDAHKLVEARAQLRVCASQDCPAQVQKDCTNWLDSVEQSLPTVVVSAKDASGHDVLDFSVTLDGQPLASKTAGEAVPLDPGPHTFHFQNADASVDQQVLVREGVKNQSVAVVLAKPGAAPAAEPASAAGSAGPASAAGASSSEASPLRTVGWVIGGVGVAGLATGAIFGIVAMGDKNGAHCDASGACDAGPLQSARNAATISTIGFVAGGVLAAGGVALVLFSPKEHRADSTAMTLAPNVGTRTAGFELTGSW